LKTGRGQKSSACFFKGWEACYEEEQILVKNSG
jgi:hypothetical protein